MSVPPSACSVKRSAAHTATDRLPRGDLFEDPAHGSAAFCSDPFGHGFCLLQRKSK